MIHADIVCKACGIVFTYESRSKKPKATCSSRCQQRTRPPLTPEQRAIKVARVRKWREENPELNRRQRKAFYDANRERLTAATREWYNSNAEYARAASRAYHEANKDEQNQRGADRYKRNADAVSAATREARRLNPEFYRARESAWYKAHRDEVTARRRERYENDAEFQAKHRANVRAWRERNPDAARAKSARDRLARMERLDGAECEDVDFLAVCERDGWRCHICELRVARHRKWPDPWAASLDHVTPLAKGGGHTWDNISLAHLRCNHIKGAREIPDTGAA